MRKLVCALLLLVVSPLYADVLSLDGGQQLNGTVNGLRGGQVSITVDGREVQVDPSRVQMVQLDNHPAFNQAEMARGEALRAAAFYRQVIPTLNRAELKHLAQLRAIGPTQADDRWTEAVELFLEVYAAAPTESIWQSRPTRFPPRSSTQLNDSARLIVAAIDGARQDEARKNLKRFLLEIHIRAGNVRQAEALAQELATGIAASTAPATEPAAHVAVEAAVEGFRQAAQAHESSGHHDQAIGAWLRIAAHYPDSSMAPAAILRAARIQVELNRLQAAQALFREITDRYPRSAEAASARQALERP